MTNKFQIGNSNLFVNLLELGTHAVEGYNLFPNLDEGDK